MVFSYPFSHILINCDCLSESKRPARFAHKQERILTLFFISNLAKRWLLYTRIVGIKCHLICLRIGVVIAKGISKGNRINCSFANLYIFSKLAVLTVEKCTFSHFNKQSERIDYIFDCISYRIDLTSTFVKFEIS